MKKEYKVIGKSLQDYTGFRKVTGRAKYSNDYNTADTLHAKLLRSPYARANILSMDTSEAESMRGVHLVMNYKTHPGFFHQSAHYWGMEIACVVASTKEIAKEALKKIKVEYEVLPFVTDGAEAMKEDAPQALLDKPNVYPWHEHAYFTNKNAQGLYTTRTYAEYDGFGDVQSGYDESEVVVSDDGYSFGFVRAPLMKPTTCLANFSDGFLDLHFDVQQPYTARKDLCSWLDMPFSKVRVHNEINACSFGAHAAGCLETGMTGASCTLIAALAAIALCKPVALEYTLDEDKLFFWGRGTFDSKYDLGFKKDGTMVMVNGEVFRNAATGDSTGESTQGDDMTATGNMLYSHNVQHSRHFKYRVYTNSPGWTGWQAFGNPEVFFPVESVMDKAAEELGIDPVDLQKMNVIRKGDNFLVGSYDFEGPQFLSRDGMIPCIDAGIEYTDWYNRRKKPEEKTGRIRHGMGMSPGAMQNAGQGIASQSIVILNSDGSATLMCNYADIGQGGHGTQLQIVAEVLDLSMDKVKINTGDTDTPFAHYQIASSGTIASGRATYNAAMDVKNKILKRTADVLNVAVETLDMKDGKVVSLIDDDMEIPWVPPLREYVAHNPSPEIEYLTNPVLDCVGYGTSYIGSGATSAELAATFVELDVDTETGEISNVEIFHAQDCGKAINPKIVESQWLTIHHGVEAMTGAEQILDPKTGKLLNDNWYDYALSTALDSTVTTQIIEVFDPTHPFGATGCGQVVMHSLPGAFAAAIYNAIGVRMKSTPFTPAKILAALAEKEGQ